MLKQACLRIELASTDVVQTDWVNYENPNALRQLSYDIETTLKSESGFIYGKIDEVEIYYNIKYVVGIAILTQEIPSGNAR